jgi:hypothetical protein
MWSETMTIIMMMSALFGVKALLLVALASSRRRLDWLRIEVHRAASVSWNQGET